MYGAADSLVAHVSRNPGYGLFDAFADIALVPSTVALLLFVALIFSSIGGMAIASILKYLDNIVKEYTASVANIFTAVVCSMLFPDKFQLTVYVVMSLGSLCSGIYLYERFRVKQQPSSK